MPLQTSEVDEVWNMHSHRNGAPPAQERPPLPQNLQATKSPVSPHEAFVASSNAILTRLNNVKRRAYYYADEFVSGTGVFGIPTTPTAVGTRKDSSRRSGFSGVLSAIGNAAASVAHYFKMNPMHFERDLVPCCYLLAIKLQSLTLHADLDMVQAAEELTSIMEELDAVLFSSICDESSNDYRVAVKPSANRNHPQRHDVELNVSSSDSFDDAVLQQVLRTTGNVPGVDDEPVNPHHNDVAPPQPEPHSSALQQLTEEAALRQCLHRLSAVELLLKQMLRATQEAFEKRSTSLVDSICATLRAVLGLSSSQAGCTAAWFFAMSSVITAAYLLIETTTNADVTAKPLSVSAMMFLGPIGVAILLRVLRPLVVPWTDDIVLNAITLGVSIGIPLTACLSGPNFEVHSREIGLLMSYMAICWRISAKNLYVVVISIAAFTLLSLLGLVRGSVSTVVEVVEISLPIGLVILSEAMFLRKSIGTFQVSALVCSNKMCDLLVRFAGGKQLQQGLMSSTDECIGAMINNAIATTGVDSYLQQRRAFSSGAVEQQAGGPSSGASLQSPMHPSMMHGAVYCLSDVMNHVAMEYGLQLEYTSSNETKAAVMVNGNPEKATRVIEVLLSNIASVRAKDLIASVTRIGLPAGADSDSSSPAGLLSSGAERRGSHSVATVQSWRDTAVMFRIEVNHRMWCDEMQWLNPSSVAAMRMECEGSGLSVVYSSDLGLVLRFHNAEMSRLSLRMLVPANQGDETVLIVHESVPVQLTLAQLLWEQGVSTCVMKELPVSDEMHVRTYAGAILPFEMFLPGGLADEVDLPTLLPFSFVTALDLSGAWSSTNAPQEVTLSDRLHMVFHGLPSSLNAMQYHHFMLEVRLRSATKYPLLAPSAFHNPAPMRKVGVGSAAVVHKVRFEDGTVAAMKVIRTRSLQRYHLSVDEAYQEEQEKTKLNHPNILNVLHVERGGGIAQGTEIIVFSELCSEVNLRSLLQSGPVTSREASRITFELLCGLEYLHSNHTFAGDLKSENILFGPLRKVKIADYGSKLITINWRAPEFACRAPSTPDEREKADVWALGCVQLEMLYGHDYLPFSSNHANAASAAIAGAQSASARAAAAAAVAAATRDGNVIGQTSFGASGLPPPIIFGSEDGSTMPPPTEAEAFLPTHGPSPPTINPLQITRAVGSSSTPPPRSSNLLLGASTLPRLGLSSVTTSAQASGTSVSGLGAPSPAAATQLELPVNMNSEWREFIFMCLRPEPSLRPTLDQLLGLRFVNRVGMSHDPASSGGRSHYLRQQNLANAAAGMQSQSSGGGGSSVNWPCTLEE